jgi:hypothetical protein
MLVCQTILYCSYKLTKKESMSKYQLESYRIFPYVAWAVFLGFALFVGLLTRELTLTTQAYALTDTSLDIQLQQLEKRTPTDTVQ